MLGCLWNCISIHESSDEYARRHDLCRRKSRDGRTKNAIDKATACDRPGSYRIPRDLCLESNATGSCGKGDFNLPGQNRFRRFRLAGNWPTLAARAWGRISSTSRSVFGWNDQPELDRFQGDQIGRRQMVNQDFALGRTACSQARSSPSHRASGGKCQREEEHASHAVHDATLSGPFSSVNEMGMRDLELRAPSVILGSSEQRGARVWRDAQ